MNIKKEIVDSINILVESTIKKTCPTISFGVVVGIVSKGKCTIRINNIDYSINYYGGAAPEINQKYPVFVPFNKMSLAFIISGGDGGSHGTTDYEQLINKPQINGVTLSGNQTASSLDLEPEISAGTTSQYWRGDKTWQTLNKSTVGLDNVDNVKQYSASNPPPYPVTSVNNKTGDVSINATDVNALPISGGTMTGAINMGSHKITNVTAGTANTDAVNKKQLDDAIAGVGTVFNFKGSVATVADLPSSGNKIGDVWYVESEHVGYIWLTDSTSPAGRWEQLGPTVDLSGYLRKAELASSTGSSTTTAMTQKATTDALNNKVDKVSGKGLSTNDYTTAEKNKLDGIQSGAEVNIQSDWDVVDSSSDAYIKNKPVIWEPIIKVDTAAGTSAKIGNTSYYTLDSNHYLYVAIVNSNTSANALTLNINSKGAKPIYINGVASSSSNYSLPSGQYLVYYDGSKYNFRTDGQLPYFPIASASQLGGIKVGNGLQIDSSGSLSVSRGGEGNTFTVFFDFENEQITANITPAEAYQKFEDGTYMLGMLRNQNTGFYDYLELVSATSHSVSFKTRVSSVLGVDFIIGSSTIGGSEGKVGVIGNKTNNTWTYSISPILSLPIASTTMLGGVRVGNGLSVDSGGTMSLSLPTASSSVLGGVKVGSGLSINSSGVLSANAAPVSSVNGQTGAVTTANGFTITLSSSGWSSNTQTITNSNFVTSGYIYNVTPASSSYLAYGESQIYADDVTVANKITFHCQKVPTTNLTVNIGRIKTG